LALRRCKYLIAAVPFARNRNRRARHLGARSLSTLLFSIPRPASCATPGTSSFSVFSPGLPRQLVLVGIVASFSPLSYPTTTGEARRAVIRELSSSNRSRVGVRLCWRFALEKKSSSLIGRAIATRVSATILSPREGEDSEGVPGYLCR